MSPAVSYGAIVRPVCDLILSSVMCRPCVTGSRVTSPVHARASALCAPCRQRHRPPAHPAYARVCGTCVTSTTPSSSTNGEVGQRRSYYLILIHRPLLHLFSTVSVVCGSDARRAQCVPGGRGVHAAAGGQGQARHPAVQLLQATGTHIMHIHYVCYTDHMHLSLPAISPTPPAGLAGLVHASVEGDGLRPTALPGRGHVGRAGLPGAYDATHTGALQPDQGAQVRHMCMQVEGQWRPHRHSSSF